MAAACFKASVARRQLKQNGHRGKESEQVLKIFFDTSAFVKRYIEESGSEEVIKACDVAEDIAVSALLPVEAVNAIMRIQRENRLTASDYGKIKNALFCDLRDAVIIPIIPEIIGLAIKIIETAPVKAYDAMHIACAQFSRSNLFVTGDHQQLAAAQKTGLCVRCV